VGWSCSELTPLVEASDEQDFAEHDFAEDDTHSPGRAWLGPAGAAFFSDFWHFCVWGADGTITEAVRHCVRLRLSAC